MTGRILVVDDVKANVRLLEARLLAEYFEVKTAENGQEALRVLAGWPCDVVLLDVMMPGLDGFETCRRIKADPRTTHVPVVMITALDQSGDRIRGFEAGADDFLTKPINDMALVTRVKNLIGLKRTTDELRMRAETGVQLGLGSEEPKAAGASRVIVVDDHPTSAERLRDILTAEHRVEIEGEPQQALFRIAEEGFDLVVLNQSLACFDALRLVSQLRALDRTRLTPILVVSDPDDTPRLMRGLELGVNDYVTRPVEKNEFRLRARGQIARKHANDRLVSDAQRTITLAITDALTGLHNRRYLETHLRTLVHGTMERAGDLSVLMLDIDFFKAVNDTHGHDAGDDVLREFARRVRINIRGLDLAARLGGEEFVIVMPDTSAAVAGVVAERVRRIIGSEPFQILGGSKAITVTASVGVATYNGAGDTAERLLKRADKALYAAKRDGRNRVVSEVA